MPPFFGHLEEPRIFHCVMLWLLLLCLLWAGSLVEMAEYDLTVTPSSVTVQEGLCIYVSCQASFPTSSSSAFGYWFQEKADTNKDLPVATNDPNRPVQKEAQGRFHLMGGQDPRNCSLEIRDVKRSDTQVYFYRVDDGNKVKWSFKVPKNLLSVTVTELKLTLRPQDHGTNITCQVTFPGVGVTVERTEQLNVTYAPQKLTIRASRGENTEPETLHSGSSLHIQEGESLRLVCAADSNPPAVLNWEQQTQKHVQLSNEELQLPRVELEDHGKYICRAQNSLGAQVASVSLIIRSLLQLLAPSCSWEAVGLHCSCSSRAWPTPSLRWWLGEGLLEGNSSNNSFQVTSTSSGLWANSSLILSKEFSAGHRLRCEAWTDNEVQSATMLLLPSQEVTKDKPDPSIGVLQGAVGGAGLMAVCLCLVFFIVKLLRKKSALKVASIEGNPAGSPVSSMISSGILGHLKASGSQNQKDRPPFATVLHTLTDEPELHYATLSFHNLKPRQPQNTETIKSDYTEIKIRKC
ncbi:sialic acid-binding Ig-like lectin 5 isoform X2 [Microtus pennsylvanicus]|uniref:sialic acid-binding Ig-like lectin 5 isoform X2 n=1 Tax=Microtus pennsylvanicus TaxID=10058 RepID=UPI003F6C3BFE